MNHLPLALGLALLANGCSSGLGDFCYSNADCQSALRCTARGGHRGICVHPDAVRDAGLHDASPRSDGTSPNDAARRDGRLDLRPTDATSDREAPADLRLRDTSNRDAGRVDAFPLDAARDASPELRASGDGPVAKDLRGQ